MYNIIRLYRRASFYTMGYLVLAKTLAAYVNGINNCPNIPNPNQIQVPAMLCSRLP